MMRDPLRVRTMPGMVVTKDSRLDLKVTYPILYDQRVCEIGDVPYTDVLKLLQYRKEIHDSGEDGRKAVEKRIVTRYWT